MLSRHIVMSAVGGAMLVGAPLLAQQRADLPPPSTSRAPLLTAMTTDSIRLYTALLRVGELLQSIQEGDGAAGDALLRDATLSPSTCGSVREAFSNAVTQVRNISRSDGRTSLLLFFDKIAIADSGTTLVVTADLIAVPKTTSAPRRTSVRLVLHAERAIWISENGFISGLCSL